MRELSIFIDESGDFGVANKLPSYYLTTFVFHEQNKSISKVEQLENRIKNNIFNIEYLHSMPIIRKESIFDIYSLDDRRKLLYCMLNLEKPFHKSINYYKSQILFVQLSY